MNTKQQPQISERVYQEVVSRIEHGKVPLYPSLVRRKAIERYKAEKIAEIERAKRETERKIREAQRRREARRRREERRRYEEMKKALEASKKRVHAGHWVKIEEGGKSVSEMGIAAMSPSQAKALGYKWGTAKWNPKTGTYEFVPIPSAPSEPEYYGILKWKYESGHYKRPEVAEQIKKEIEIGAKKYGIVAPAWAGGYLKEYEQIARQIKESYLKATQSETKPSAIELKKALDSQSKVMQDLQRLQTQRAMLEKQIKATTHLAEEAKAKYGKYEKGGWTPEEIVKYGLLAGTVGGISKTLESQISEYNKQVQQLRESIKREQQRPVQPSVRVSIPKQTVVKPAVTTKKSEIPVVYSPLMQEIKATGKVPTVHIPEQTKPPTVFEASVEPIKRITKYIEATEKKYSPYVKKAIPPVRPYAEVKTPGDLVKAVEQTYKWRGAELSKEQREAIEESYIRGKKTYSTYRRMFGLPPESFKWEKKAAQIEAGIKVGAIEEIREHPIKGAITVASFAAMPPVFKGAGAVWKGAGLATKLPRITKYAPKIILGGMGAGYAGGVGYETYKAPTLEKKGEVLGRTSVEMAEMGAGSYIGMKAPPYIKNIIEIPSTTIKKIYGGFRIRKGIKKPVRQWSLSDIKSIEEYLAMHRARGGIARARRLEELGKRKLEMKKEPYETVFTSGIAPSEIYGGAVPTPRIEMPKLPRPSHLPPEMMTSGIVKGEELKIIGYKHPKYEVRLTSGFKGKPPALARIGLGEEQWISGLTEAEKAKIKSMMKPAQEPIAQEMIKRIVKPQLYPEYTTKHLLGLMREPKIGESHYEIYKKSVLTLPEDLPLQIRFKRIKEPKPKEPKVLVLGSTAEYFRTLMESLKFPQVYGEISAITKPERILPIRVGRISSGKGLRVKYTDRGLMIGEAESIKRRMESMGKELSESARFISIGREGKIKKLKEEGTKYKREAQGGALKEKEVGGGQIVLQKTEQKPEIEEVKLTTKDIEEVITGKKTHKIKQPRTIYEEFKESIVTKPRIEPILIWKPKIRRKVRMPALPFYLPSTKEPKAFKEARDYIERLEEKKRTKYTPYEWQKFVPLSYEEYKFEPISLERFRSKQISIPLPITSTPPATPSIRIPKIRFPEIQRPKEMLKTPTPEIKPPEILFYFPFPHEKKKRPRHRKYRRSPYEWFEYHPIPTLKEIFGVVGLPQQKSRTKAKHSTELTSVINQLIGKPKL